MNLTLDDLIFEQKQYVIAKVKHNQAIINFGEGEGEFMVAQFEIEPSMIGAVLLFKQDYEKLLSKIEGAENELKY